MSRSPHEELRCLLTRQIYEAEFKARQEAVRIRKQADEDEDRVYNCMYQTTEAARRMVATLDKITADTAAIVSALVEVGSTEGGAPDDKTV